MLAPDLAGFETVDDVNAVADPIYPGLAVLDRPFVPHVRSPGLPETHDCDAISASMSSTEIEHWALRDGDVLLIDGHTGELLLRPEL